MYLTFDQYINLGGNLMETAFNRFEFKARQLINNATFSRLVNYDLSEDKKTREVVERCMYELIDFISKYDITQVTPVQSVSNDGVSKTFAKIEATYETNSLINLFLSNVVVNGVPLLYLGVDNRGRI